ncbi:MAG: cytochrome c3 family protein [Candidatus Atribacteria bacterium]|nr:cytochrome c3 family protein [Candidatus Atribacteria bacterium]
MDLVTEEQWVGIPCAQCHEVDTNGTASVAIAWLSPISLVYEPLNTPNELCMKCHVDGTGNKGSAGGGANHAIILGGSAHANFAGEWPQADRPKYCTDCHDAHSSDVKQCVDCHTNTADTHPKLSIMLDTVTCMACHDASGAEVGYAVEGGPFTTLMTTLGTRGAPDTVAEIVSHSIVWKVTCTRCHFVDNPWGLTVLTATGAVAPIPTATPKP